MENYNNSIDQELFREYKLHEIIISITYGEKISVVWNNNKTELDKWAGEKILEYKRKNCVKKSSSILAFFFTSRRRCKIIN